MHILRALYKFIPRMALPSGSPRNRASQPPMQGCGKSREQQTKGANRGRCLSTSGVARKPRIRETLPPRRRVGRIASRERESERERERGCFAARPPPRALPIKYNTRERERGRGREKKKRTLERNMKTLQASPLREFIVPPTLIRRKARPPSGRAS